MREAPTLKPVLVTGGNGQLAVSLADVGGARVIKVGRPDFDFDRPETIDAVVARYDPAFVVNAAAWTAVDAAETEVAAASRANQTGPAILAAACATQGCGLIHISTDYVFAGDKGTPYVESDPTSPRTVYGATKAAGETAVLAACPQAIILRTAWVYSAHGKNFVKTMIAAGARNPKLRVVGDQFGNPTSAEDLAQAIFAIIARIEETGWQAAYPGVYHATAQGETTWHGLAVATLEQAARHGQTLPEIEAIRTQDWPTPAERPQDSRLNCTKLKQVFGVSLPNWRQSVARTVDRVLGA
ncbi:dTDP-4-dehydrorhamnose reductase [Novacetimonas hansenii]|uniref:dTDP-4-dehydrorhamnose reductase n=1 Tax=Novacetimonas hansenii TaxID=436 RepID=UPI000789BC87|nr:dTDP-4-dehydrorhamnose reductase [Novacetimonas hansenii]RFP05946.1 dTDP-4-dehydrorhamnose reductase [Novacetimonas hansenii]WEQ58107.1 dTDP-4-dehydrorhamnose reductase [Novacetimonas hansenii]CUW45955.1 dTDP-4-dehydrorhamnose reductase [Novacetimonas hansenii]